MNCILITSVNQPSLQVFWSLHSFPSAVHDVNTRTAHRVDFCILFTRIGFLAASISSLEIVGSKTLLCFLWV